MKFQTSQSNVGVSPWTSFPLQYLHSCFVSTAKNNRNSKKKKCNKRIVKLFRKKASGTWCLSQSRDSKFEVYSFRVTLTINKSIILCLASKWLCCVIFEIMLGKVLEVWARLPKCNSHFFFTHQHLWRCQVSWFW